MTIGSEPSDEYHPYVKVVVSDNGTGIRELSEDSLFDPFYTTKEQGLGQGLSISRSIVESHGGTIRARNNKDQGASFEFTLPIDGNGTANQ
ncbi:MAG: hypothetical protein HUJ31_10915 [Pseudomonadales bacterium]|nr:hypothetical protein [Pseudomonadales bacterium]